jgi:predicted 3-demethylubiquinone-9 3-methyltransferase (glyoxalase superfamily)
LSWQIIPERLGELVQNPSAMKAMLEMDKIDLARLERAAAQAR